MYILADKKQREHLKKKLLKNRRSLTYELEAIEDTRMYTYPNLLNVEFRKYRQLSKLESVCE